MILDKDGNTINNYDLDKGYLEITQNGQYMYKEFTENELDIMSIKYQINELKEQLLQTDYKTLKYIEGYYTEEEFNAIKNTRKELRNKINELEGKL